MMVMANVFLFLNVIYVSLMKFAILAGAGAGKE